MRLSPRLWFAAMAIGLQVAAAPAGAASRPGPSQHAAGGFVAISTPDLDRAAAWYGRMLEFETLRRGDAGAGLRIALLARPDGHLLELVERPEADHAGPPPPDASHRHGIFKTGFFVADVEDAAATLERRGARFLHGVVRPPGSAWRTFAVADPDGNVIQIFGP